MTVLKVETLFEQRKYVQCKECGTTMSYAPEDVVRSSGSHYMIKVGGTQQHNGRVVARARTFIVCVTETCKARVEV